MKEIWKDIKGYEGTYQISNLGNVLSVARGKPKLRKQSTDKDGYKYLILCKDGINKNHFVHRLVAAAFIENPTNHPVINHKDENKSNNSYKNLEWCTYKYNLHYGTCIERITQLATERQGKPVVKKSLSGDVLSSYKSIGEAARSCGLYTGAICACCKGNIKKYKGFTWEYA